MELQGRIIERGETEVISDRFSKRTIVIETEGNGEGKYQQTIPIEFTNDRIELIEGFPVGSNVVISIEIRGRRWQKPGMEKPKYFCSISGWRIQSAGGSTTGGRAPPALGPDDDIPFAPIFDV